MRPQPRAAIRGPYAWPSRNGAVTQVGLDPPRAQRRGRGAQPVTVAGRQGDRDAGPYSESRKPLRYTVGRRGTGRRDRTGGQPARTRKRRSGRPVGGTGYPRAVPTYLTLDEHLAGLARGGAALHRAAAAAGLAAPVPTCPSWDVTALVTHQGMVHRWAAANLRGDRKHDPAASLAEAARSGDLLGWYEAGLAALTDTIRSVPDDPGILVFLNDAPPPRRFWARRQAHETTIHGVDAVAAVLGRWPGVSDVDIEPALAADGVDELLTGFITRRRGELRAAEPYAVRVRAADTGHDWTVRVSDGPVVTTVGGTGDADATFTGTAAQLYLSLWNRADEISVTGRPDVLDRWRTEVRVRWG